MSLATQRFNFLEQAFNMKQPYVSRNLFPPILACVVFFASTIPVLGVTGPELFAALGNATGLGMTAWDKTKIMDLPEYPTEILPLRVGAKAAEHGDAVLSLGGRVLQFPSNWKQLYVRIGGSQSTLYSANGDDAGGGQERTVGGTIKPNAKGSYNTGQAPDQGFRLQLNAQRQTLDWTPRMVRIGPAVDRGDAAEDWVEDAADLTIIASWPGGKEGAVKYIGSNQAAAAGSSFKEYLSARTNADAASVLGIQVKIMTFLEKALVLAGSSAPDAKQAVTAAVKKVNAMDPLSQLDLLLNAEDALKNAKTSEEAVMAYLALHTRNAISFGPRVYTRTRGEWTLRVIECAPKVTLHYERQVRDYWAYLQQGRKVVWSAFIRRPYGTLGEADIPALVAAMPASPVTEPPPPATRPAK